MSATIITDMSSVERYAEYWMPFILKHPELEFIFTRFTTPGRPRCKGRNIMVTDRGRNAAVSMANNESVFLTYEHAIPTYQTAILLASLRGNNVSVWPTWQDKSIRTPSQSFSVLKSLYKIDMAPTEYINITGAKVIDHTTLYHL